MRATVVALTFLTLAGVMPGEPLAAQAPPPEAGLEHEVRQLNDTLGELVELLRQQLESTNAAVLMQRVQLMTSRIAPLEAELRTARDEQSDLQDRLDDIDLSEAAIRGSVETQIELGQVSEEEARLRLEEHARITIENRKQTESRLWAAQQRVIDLEQAIAAQRTVLETWEGEIDRVLGLR